MGTDVHPGSANPHAQRAKYKVVPRAVQQQVAFGQQLWSGKGSQYDQSQAPVQQCQHVQRNDSRRRATRQIIDWLKRRGDKKQCQGPAAAVEKWHGVRGLQCKSD